MTAQQQFDRLQAAFPGQYVSIKAAINGGATVERYSAFVAYVESEGHEIAENLNAAVEAQIAKAARKSQTAEDASPVIDQMEGAAQ